MLSGSLSLKEGGGEAVVEKVNNTWAVVKVCLSTITENCAFTGFLMRDLKIGFERP